jgi:non-specific serine/threonine protein kinase
MIGKLISHYRILEELGRGGMGIVYKAEDTRLERFVAIKFLPHQIAANENERDRFKVEAKAAAALNHPNIATIHAIEEAPNGRGEMFIVMEFIDGKELKQLIIDNSQLSIDNCLSYAIQIAEGLKAAHAKGIIHRDIKSSNIMVTESGQVKIMDFGLAKIGGGVHLTKTSTTVGTAAYMSPEQARCKPVDHRTDIWSFGIVLYEMLTGRLPFRGEYEQAVLYSIVNENPEPLARCRTDVPEAVQMIVEKALQKDAGTRHQTAIEILTDLKSWQAGLTPTFAELSPRKPKEPAPNNLPSQLTSFIGREREIEEIKALLSTARLVTLTGPGGTGKTRLGLQVAASLLNDFESGVFFVALASISDPGLVASSIAQTLGVKDTGVRPILESLKNFLQAKQTLILLDNFEHVVDAATLVTELLSACPRLKVLVTSREPLHVYGEHQFPVPPLTLPEPKQLPPIESLSHYEAVALFIQRALAVKPDFVLTDENAPAVAEICIRLDGLPLAIELAAARIKLLPPHAILDKLEHRFNLLTGGPRDLPARQQTLRGAIEWSYALLDEEEKKLLRRLSVFAGGCTLEAAEAVCNWFVVAPSGAGRAEGENFSPPPQSSSSPRSPMPEGITTNLKVEVLDGLTSLVDKSLLRQIEQPDGEPRFMMLETIREFGLECLIAGGEKEAFRQAHRDFFLKFSEEAESQLTGPQQKKWLESLEQEHDNLRSAFDWSLKNNGEMEAGLRSARRCGVSGLCAAM